MRSIGRFIKTHLAGCSAICAGTLIVALVTLAWPARALIINATYDSTLTSQPNAAQIEAAYGVVITNFETLYTNPATINITVHWGGSGFGSSQEPLYGEYPYSELVSALQAARTTPEDTNAVASLPGSDPTAGNDWLVNRALLKVLPSLDSGTGTSPNDTANDGDVYFASSGVTWTFNPLNRAVAGQYDFIAVAEHETAEVMGRNYCLGVGISGDYVPYDLFRFTSSGVRSIYAFDTGVYFSVNNGVTALKPFNAVTSSDYTSEDAQDWMPTNLPDSYDWELSSDTKGVLSSADLTALDILGYDLNFKQPKLTGTRLSNGTFQVTFTVTNVTGLGFTVWGTTNIVLPAANWVKLGTTTESSMGHYQYTDSSATRYRFYRAELQ